MKKYISLLLVSLLFAGSAFAAQLNTNGLTAEQQAQLEAQVATIKAENITNKTDGVLEVIDNLDEEDINRYAQIGSVITDTITQTASGLGIAADEFVSTGTGTLVMFLIVYHFFGAELVTLVFGFVFMIPLTLWLSRRFLRAVKTKGYTELDEKGKQSLIFKTELTDEESHTVAWIFGITIVATLIQVLIYLP